MKRILVYLAVVSGMLVGIVVAQDRAYNPPCAEVLKFTPAAFSDRYTARNNDGSELALDDAAITWANCKYDTNLARLKDSPARRSRLVQLHKLQREFFAAETELAYSNAGGGTMFTHGFARFQPDLQLHLQAIIALTATRAGAAQSAGITARYASARRAVEMRINRVQTPRPFTDGRSASEAASAKAAWVEQAKRYRTQYQSILKLIGSRVDATSVTIMEFLARGLWTEELK